MHQEYVHTLQEIIDEDQPLLFHLHGGREQDPVPKRGRTVSLSSSSNETASGGVSKHIRSLSGAAGASRTRTHGVSTSESRVRETIRNGEIVPIEYREGFARSQEQDRQAAAFSTGTGRVLGEPTRSQLVQRTLKRAYGEWIRSFGLIFVGVLGLFATTLFSSLSPLLVSWLAQQHGLTITSKIAEPFNGPVHSTLSSLGQTVELDGLHYFVPGKPSHILEISQTCQSSYCRRDASDLFPLTVVESSAGRFGVEEFNSILSDYAARDDVWQGGFAENVILHHNQTISQASLDPTFSIKGRGSIFLNGLQAKANSRAVSLLRNSHLPAGPYFATVRGGKLALYQVWRLHADTARAFFYGTVPHPKDDLSFSVLSASLPDANGVAVIGVPSRLYYKKTADRPLAGVRVSVKDLYDLKGTKTSMGSRGWFEMYPVAASTAPSVQRLIDLGAIIVGKTRLSQFATGQYGTADNVDYGVPFNIRGDGYQDASSSSSGSGASAAAYDFLDLALGSDTGGSARAPAGVNGVYGNRPSQGAMELSTGVLPLSPSMDTAAILAYDAKKFAQYAKAYYGGNATFESYPSFPKRLLYLVNPQTPLSHDQTSSPRPGFFPPANEAAIPIYESFVRRLEQFLGVDREIVDFYAEFHKAFGMYPAEHTGPAWSHLTAHDSWKMVGKPFEEAYKASHNGDRPFVDPPVRKIWNYGANLSEEDSLDYLERKAAFQRFISNRFMARNDSAACSNALTIFPLTDGTPSYKSDYHLAGPIYNGWNKYSISQLGQVPEVVIPIGEVPFLSKITQTFKYLPVSISIQAAEGCDFVLYDLITALADEGIIHNASPGTARTFAQ